MRFGRSNLKTASSAGVLLTTAALTATMLTAGALFFASTAAAQQDNQQQAGEQQDERAEPLRRIEQFLDERRQARPKLNPPPVGAPPLREIRADVDWQALRTLIAETRRRDGQRASSTQSTIAARPFRRGPGLYDVTPDRLPRLRAPEVSRVRMPVLAPAQDDVLQTVQVFGQDEAYSAIATTNGDVDIRISGARKKLLLPERIGPRDRLNRLRASKPPLPGIGAGYLISRSEAATDISFSRFGCGYVISVMCDDQQNDPRCAEDDFVKELASSMAVLNLAQGDRQ